jgi:cytochrome d ubiquinol oxidase subunit II
MELTVLQLIWFSLFVVLVTGYAILDGFDLGVGILHLFSKEDEERRLMLNSIGPVWDGNEVWLVTAGGALFAGFPPIYATITSGFYIPTMALLAALIFRAVAIEVRSKSPRIWWRWMWDVLFALASFLIAFLLGVVMGNLIQGVPLTIEGEFDGTLGHILTPYAILVGCMTTALFTMHGSIYLLLKTEGAFHDRLRKFVNPTIILFVLLFSITTIATLIYFPHMVDIFKHRPFLFGVVILIILSAANIPREISLKKDWRAFLSSAFTITCLMILYGIGTYPNVVRNSVDADQGSLTIYNSSSSAMTLEILLLMAVIGIPLVIAYTTGVYWIFRGKVQLNEHSY